MPRGFTLIELLISIAILGLVAGVGGNMLVASVQSYNKSQSLNALTQNGGFAMTTLKNEIQGATAVTCASSTTLQVTNKEGALIIYALTPSTCPTSNGSLTRNSSPLLNTGSSATLQVLASLGSQTSGFSCSGNLVTVTLALSQPCDSGGRIDSAATTVLTTSAVARGGYR